jgi:hypothetical protein
MLSSFAPAKVNLYLHVTGKRDDGYHLLDSLAVFPSVGDRLTYAPADGLTLQLGGTFAAGLAPEPDNLALRAARRLAQRYGRIPTPPSGCSARRGNWMVRCPISRCSSARMSRYASHGSRRGCPVSARYWNRHLSCRCLAYCSSILGSRWQPPRAEDGGQPARCLAGCRQYGRGTLGTA